jgi:hypothetical protein
MRRKDTVGTNETADLRQERREGNEIDDGQTAEKNRSQHRSSGERFENLVQQCGLTVALQNGILLAVAVIQLICRQ